MFYESVWNLTCQGSVSNPKETWESDVFWWPSLSYLKSSSVFLTLRAVLVSIPSNLSLSFPISPLFSELLFFWNSLKYQLPCRVLSQSVWLFLYFMLLLLCVHAYNIAFITYITPKLNSPRAKNTLFLVSSHPKIHETEQACKCLLYKWLSMFWQCEQTLALFEPLLNYFSFLY